MKLILLISISHFDEKSKNLLFGKGKPCQGLTGLVGYFIIISVGRLSVGRRCPIVDLIISFIISVAAGVVSYYICKWLDRKL